MEEISGMAITKMLDAKEQKTLAMKLKFIRNRGIFKVMNSTHEAVTFHPKEILGVIDFRLLGYYKIKLFHSFIVVSFKRAICIVFNN